MANYNVSHRSTTSNDAPIDLSKFPLLGMTLEKIESPEPDGFYDESTDTWSHRDWFAFSPKKSNEEC